MFSYLLWEEKQKTQGGLIKNVSRMKDSKQDKDEKSWP